MALLIAGIIFLRLSLPILGHVDQIKSVVNVSLSCLMIPHNCSHSEIC